MPAVETELPRATPAVTMRAAESAAPTGTETILSTRRLNAWFGRARVLRNVTLDFHDRAVTAVIGPSGCGKSTLLRCLNRMHETVPGAIVEGDVILEVNRKPVSSLKSYEQAASGLAKDQAVLLLLKRKGQTIYLTLRP